MLFFARIKDHLDDIGKNVPLTYYAFLALLLAGIVFSVIPGVLLLLSATTLAGSFEEISALLLLLLLIPEAITVYLYLKRSAAAVDFLNISFAVASLLYLVAWHWIWLLVLLILWYALSEFIRFRQHNNKFVFT